MIRLGTRVSIDGGIPHGFHWSGVVVGTAYVDDPARAAPAFCYVIRPDGRGFWSEDRKLFFGHVLVHSDNIKEEPKP